MVGATAVIGQGDGAGTGAIAATDVTVVSSTEITAVTGGGAKVGTFSLFVTTSAGTSAGNSGADFTYTTPVVPTVSGVSPNTGPTSGGTDITISGSFFVVGPRWYGGAGPGSRHNGAGEITAVTGGGAKAGTFSVFVTTSAGTSAGNSKADFSYT